MTLKVVQYFNLEPFLSTSYRLSRIRQKSYTSLISGSLLCLTEKNDLRLIGSVDGGVVRLLFYPFKAILVTITDAGMLSQHELTAAEGLAKEVMKVKLAGRSNKPDVTWAGDGLLAMAMGESQVRLWDILQGDNYILQLEEMMDYDTSAKINAIAYSERKREKFDIFFMYLIQFVSFSANKVQLGQINRALTQRITKKVRKV